MAVSVNIAMAGLALHGPQGCWIIPDENENEKPSKSKHKNKHKHLSLFSFEKFFLIMSTCNSQ